MAASFECMETLSVTEFQDFLRSRNISETVVDKIGDNNISGEIFLELTESDMKEVAPSLADRVVLRRLQRSGMNQATGYLDFSSKDSQLNVSPAPSTPKSSTPLYFKEFSSTPKSSTPSLFKASSSSSSSMTSKAIVFAQASTNDDGDDRWVESFSIPKTFSARTMDCISTGILTQSSRTEIIQTIAALIWVHTHHPSKFAYNTICKKLVEVHPSLADDAGDGQAAHLSWKQKLRDRCKFLRRPPTGKPPAKKRRVDSSEPVLENSEIRYETEEFEADIEVMAKEMAKKKRNSGELCRLMSRTFSSRQKWVKEEEPTVHDILSKFPAFKLAKVIKQEFRQVLKIEGTLSSLLDNWGIWKARIIQYARLEGRNRDKVMELLDEYDSLVDTSLKEDKIGVLCLKILGEVFIARYKETGKILFSFMDTVDIEEEVERISRNSPYIVALQSAQKIVFIIIVEKETLITTENFRSALLYLIGAYYIFNIAYPQESYPVLLFLQRYVLGVEDKQVVPKIVRQAVTSMNKFLI